VAVDQRKHASAGNFAVRRRELITLFGGAMVVVAVAASAQETKAVTIGVLVVASPGSERFWRLFREDLRKLGYVQGQNARFEFRSDLQLSRLPDLAAELVALKPDIIVTWFTPAALAAKQATNDIPIVMALAGNPVETGLVQSLFRPGGNVTGMAGVTAELAGKCVELIRDLLPSAQRVAALANAPDPFSNPFVEQIRRAGAATGTEINPIMIHDVGELDTAFAAMDNKRPDAVIVQPSLPTKRVAELALLHRIPAVCPIRGMVDEGGLMAYGVDERAAYNRAAIFVEKILKGAKPADLPVEQPTQFELIINLKTAKAIGLTIPPAFLARADEVIE
jgi:putative ABC transport system substrate-binding protein